ncbi:MAG: hypothetical protein WKF36_03785 [Candidatus Nitrosocosmicus sp.]
MAEVINVFAFSCVGFFPCKLNSVYGRSGVIAQKSPPSLLQLRHCTLTGIGSELTIDIHVIGEIQYLSFS